MIATGSLIYVYTFSNNVYVLSQTIIPIGGITVKGVVISDDNSKITAIFADNTVQIY
jgi:hypothetical protein